MKAPTTHIIAAFAMAALAACGSGESPDDATEMTETSADTGGAPAEEAAPSEIAGDAGAGQAVFAQCGVCHSVEPGRNGLGPSLHGIVGRAAAAVDGFTYSPAMQESGLTWTPEELDEFIENPRAEVPGTRMAFAGVRDAQARADLVAYLETLD